jgi:RNA polymerase sigma-70 factor, ECF subfamily
MGNAAALVCNLNTSFMTDARLEELYRQHFAYVWKSARRLGVSAADADDAVQETFLVARDLLATKSPDDVRSFLFGVVFNTVRRHRRKQKSSGLDARAVGDLPDSSGPSPTASTERMEAARLLEKLLGLLNDEQRAVFVLAEIEHKTLREIGEILGTSLNTAASRLRLAKAKLAEAALRMQAQEGWKTR